jgi:hypothetical protein
MKLTSVTLARTIFVALLAVASWQVVRNTSSSIQLSLADEQTEVFAAMVVNASESLRKNPAAVGDAVRSLEYVHNYYPSGTKQTLGSRLDRIIERSRSLAELQIITLLRDATGRDFGTDPDAWIQEIETTR